MVNFEQYVQIFSKGADHYGVPIVLTGSRRFKCASEESDWDFAAQFSDNWERYLEMQNFHVVPGSDYESDGDTVVVYRREFGIGRSKCIEVVLSKDIYKKKAIYEWLDTQPEIVKAYYCLPKNNRQWFWKELFSYDKELFLPK